MRIYRVDGKEQTEIPVGFQIARDGKSTPIAPPNYPHKVEYIDTTNAMPLWLLICDNQRNYKEELAAFLHAKFCHHNHIDECNWQFGPFPQAHVPCVNQAYLDKATAMLSAIHTLPSGPLSDEVAFAQALRIMRTM